MVTAAQDKDLYLSAFSRLEKDLEGTPASWIAPLRKEAMGRFEELGFPTTKMEDWKYTSLEKLAQASFETVPACSPDGLTTGMVQKLNLPGEGGCQLTFVDGHFAGEFSRLDALPDGVRLLSMAEALAEERDRVEPHLARYADHGSRAFTALNTALMADGTFLEVPEGLVVSDPIHLLYISTASEGSPRMSHPRNLLVAGKGSQVTVVETYAGLGGGASLTNQVTELALAEQAVMDHYKIQRESPRAYHLGILQARIGRNATLTSHSISTGGALARHDLNVEMAGEGGDCTLNGLYVVSGSQHVDNHTVIDHAKPHCSSRETFKGVLDGKSRGVFDGRIIVRPDAQLSDARQLNANLLLSDGALVDTKPQLEINADDVKCAHAATIGQMDPEALFYMRSRGVGASDARKLLVHGFVNDMLDRIRLDGLRKDLEGSVRRRLDAGISGEEIR